MVSLRYLFSVAISKDGTGADPFANDGARNVIGEVRLGDVPGNLSKYDLPSDI